MIDQETYERECKELEDRRKNINQDPEMKAQGFEELVPDEVLDI